MRDFFVRAKTMEHIDEREEISERVKPESGVSRNLTSVSGLSGVTRNTEDNELMEDIWADDVRDEISKFEKMKGTDDDGDSD
nr:hypothetical protein BaRGS_017496 [Batillaria attramentaria]